MYFTINSLKLSESPLAEAAGASLGNRYDKTDELGNPVLGKAKANLDDGTKVGMENPST